MTTNWRRGEKKDDRRKYMQWARSTGNTFHSHTTIFNSACSPNLQE